MEHKKKETVLLEQSLFVRLKGLEPPRLAAPDPKSGAATNYATAAKLSGDKDKTLFLFINVSRLFFIIIRRFLLIRRL